MLRLINNINTAAFKRQRSVKINYLINYKKSEKDTINHSVFLHSELPVRLAHRIKDLESLPHDFIDNHYLIDIHDQYVDSFKQIRDHPVPNTISNVEGFNDTLDDILDKHSNIHMNMYHCIKKYDNIKNQREVENTLCKFYSSRLGIRFLMQHHISEYGVISDFNVHNLLKNCVKHVDYITDRMYLELSEKIEIIGNSESSLLFVPSYLEFTVIEIVKNSVAAALGCHGEIDITIKYIVEDNNLSLKITDQSGGFDPSLISSLYSFFYTDSQVTDKNLAGYGHGLGLSKLYIEYFGGFISINTLPGCGTTCDIYIPNIVNNTEKL
jgi:pyruvate dehydrogenase kinase 2/3/4